MNENLNLGSKIHERAKILFLFVKLYFDIFSSKIFLIFSLKDLTKFESKILFFKLLLIFSIIGKMHEIVI